MKILQILPELNSGGVERGTLEIARALVAGGHQAVVVSNGGRLVDELERIGARHVALPVHRKSLKSLLQVRALRRVFEREKPDIVHIRSRVPGWIAWLAWRGMDPRTRPHLVSTVHGFYSVNAYSKIMTCGERVIAVSESIREYILRNYPKVEPNRITVIHRGVDPVAYPHGYAAPTAWVEGFEQEFPGVRGRMLVTLPGRITRWKGAFDLVEIIARLKQSGLPVHGLLVGETHPKKRAFERELRAKIASRGLESDITFTGPRGDLREIMAISRAVLSLSSDPEAFGRVTLEALMLGRPVLAYNHGGVAEQLAVMLPEGGVPPNDWEEVARRLESWLSGTPPLPKPDEQFSLDNMLRRTLAVYANVLTPSRAD
jgi:glycosyltransferase involved in cell wall biosynthesis